MADVDLFWLVAGSVALTGYGLACVIWPWATCSRCRGRGKLPSPTGRYHRSCPRCTGSGRLYRVPVRVHRFLTGRGRR
jgi:DnaJ-class molecular chaperone